MERSNMPCGRGRGNPLRSRRTESPVSARSGMSERDMLHLVLMINADGQNTVRADEILRIGHLRNRALVDMTSTL
eukprot:131954-Pyramimonas_sp.AAC.1